MEGSDVRPLPLHRHHQDVMDTSSPHSSELPDVCHHPASGQGYRNGANSGPGTGQYAHSHHQDRHVAPASTKMLQLLEKLDNGDTDEDDGAQHNSERKRVRSAPDPQVRGPRETQRHEKRYRRNDRGTGEWWQDEAPQNYPRHFVDQPERGPHSNEACAERSDSKQSPVRAEEPSVRHHAAAPLGASLPTALNDGPGGQPPNDDSPREGSAQSVQEGQSPLQPPRPQSQQQEHAPQPTNVADPVAPTAVPSSSIPAPAVPTPPAAPSLPPKSAGNPVLVSRAGHLGSTYSPATLSGVPLAPGQQLPPPFGMPPSWHQAMLLQHMQANQQHMHNAFMMSQSNGAAGRPVLPMPQRGPSPLPGAVAPPPGGGGGSGAPRGIPMNIPQNGNARPSSLTTGLLASMQANNAQANGGSGMGPAAQFRMANQHQTMPGRTGQTANQVAAPAPVQPLASVPRPPSAMAFSELSLGLPDSLQGLQDLNFCAEDFDAVLDGLPPFESLPFPDDAAATKA
jgi:hypothetical protein